MVITSPQPFPHHNTKLIRSPPLPRFDTQDTLYDLTFSESHSTRLLTASGDGTLKLFDLSIPASTPYPIATWSEHSREVFACAWNLVSKTRFLSSSWDGCVKIYDPEREQSLLTLPTGTCTYSAQWSPHEDGVVSAVGGDGVTRVFDLRTPASARNHLVASIGSGNGMGMGIGMGVPPASAGMKGPPPAELLTHDWNKYRSTILATGSVDKLIRTFDLRNPNAGPVAVLTGHDYAVRRVAWSPHLSDLLLSASYDMSCRVWTDGQAIGVGQDQLQGQPAMGFGKELGRMDQHTEFATGVDWCLFGAEGWCASTAWDERVLVWDVRAVMGR
jgi:peroxin-7